MRYILAFVAIVATCAALTSGFIYAIDSEFADQVVHSNLYPKVTK